VIGLKGGKKKDKEVSKKESKHSVDEPAAAKPALQDDQDILDKVYGRGRVKKNVGGGEEEKSDVKGMSFECMNTITKMVSLDGEL